MDYNKILSKNGYIINKKSITDKKLSQIKKDLMVKPKVNDDYGAEIVYYQLYEEDDETITIPRYYGINKFGKPELTDMDGEEVNFEFIGELREKQIPIIETSVKHMRAHGGGLLQLHCGAGKTVLALYIACILKVKTLIIVHKTFLQNQWYERIKEFTTARIGLIRQKKTDIYEKDIVVGMLQSISMIDYDPAIFEGFELVIVDECHHIASRVFSRALAKTGFKYTLGLSATPKRSDGLTRVINWYLGDTMYKLERTGVSNVIVKTFNYFSNNPKYKESKRYVRNKGMKPHIPIMVTNISEYEERNIFLINLINTLRNQEERKLLVLSGRIKHLELLKESVDCTIKLEEEKGDLEENEIKTAFYIGKMKEYELVDSAEADIIFASYEMAEEGLDIPSLNTLILSTPPKNQKTVVQCLGRIMRKQAKDCDVNPLVIDIVDHFSLFSRQGSTRLKHYNKKEYTVNKYNVIDENLVTKNDFMFKIYGQSHMDFIEDLRKIGEYEDSDDEYELDLNEVMMVDTDF